MSQAMQVLAPVVQAVPATGQVGGGAESPDSGQSFQSVLADQIAPGESPVRDTGSLECTEPAPAPDVMTDTNTPLTVDIATSGNPLPPLLPPVALDLAAGLGTASATAVKALTDETRAPVAADAQPPLADGLAEALAAAMTIVPVSIQPPVELAADVQVAGALASSLQPPVESNLAASIVAADTPAPGAANILAAEAAASSLGRTVVSNSATRVAAAATPAIPAANAAVAAAAASSIVSNSATRVAAAATPAIPAANAAVAEAAAVSMKTAGMEVSPEVLRAALKEITPSADTRSAPTSPQAPLGLVSANSFANAFVSAQSTATPTGSATIPVPFGQPGWGQAFNNQVVWAVNQGMPAAQLHLSPPDLGPMSVRISMEQDQASMTFNSPHAMVREAIEAALPRLRDMLDSQGITLVNVNVSQHGSAHTQREPGAWRNEADGAAGTASVSGPGNDSGVAGTRVAVGLLDVFV